MSNSRESFTHEDPERLERLYLIQRVAGNYKSWELHRLEERLWDSRAAILRRPHRSGGLSHTSPSICGEKKR